MTEKIKRGRFSPSFKALIWLLAASFTLHDVAFAAPSLPAVTLPGDVVANPSLLNVPSDFARLRESHRGSQKRLLIHIQDAHTNSSSQENTAKLLETLAKRYGVKTVFIEGGTTDDSLAFLRPLASPAVRARVGKKYVMRGQLNGAEFETLASDLDLNLWGIEDKALYGEALKAYADVVSRREGVLPYIGLLRTRIETLKRRVFSKEAIAFDEAVKHFEKKDIGFTDFYATLEDYAARTHVNLLGYPAFLSLKDLKTEEAAVDFKKANEEFAALITRLYPDENDRRKVLEEETLAPSNDGGIGKLKAHSPNPAAFYETLLSDARAKKIGLDGFDDFQKYVHYLKTYSAVDMFSLMDDMQAIREAVYRGLLTDADAYYLHEIDNHVDSLEKFFNLEFSKDEFEAYSNRMAEDRFHTVYLIGFLNRKLYESAQYEDVIAYEPVIDDAKKDAEVFYRTNDVRDEAFMKNVEAKMSSQNLDKAVLITGGYHADHLKTLMDKAGFSYAEVMPNVTCETNHARYEQLLLSELGEKNPLAEKTPYAEKHSSLILQENAETGQWLTIGKDLASGNPQAEETLRALAAARLATNNPPPVSDEFFRKLQNELSSVQEKISAGRASENYRELTQLLGRESFLKKQMAVYQAARLAISGSHENGVTTFVINGQSISGASRGQLLSVLRIARNDGLISPRWSFRQNDEDKDKIEITLDKAWFSPGKNWDFDWNDPDALIQIFRNAEGAQGARLAALNDNMFKTGFSRIIYQKDKAGKPLYLLKRPVNSVWEMARRASEIMKNSKPAVEIIAVPKPESRVAPRLQYQVIPWIPIADLKGWHEDPARLIAGYINGRDQLNISQKNIAWNFVLAFCTLSDGTDGIALVIVPIIKGGQDIIEEGPGWNPDQEPGSPVLNPNLPSRGPLNAALEEPHDESGARLAGGTLEELTRESTGLKEDISNLYRELNYWQNELSIAKRQLDSANALGVDKPSIQSLVDRTAEAQKNISDYQDHIKLRSYELGQVTEKIEELSKGARLATAVSPVPQTARPSISQVEYTRQLLKMYLSAIPDNAGLERQIGEATTLDQIDQAAEALRLALNEKYQHLSHKPQSDLSLDEAYYEVTGKRISAARLAISVQDKENFKHSLITWYVPSLNELGDETKPFLKDQNRKVKAAAKSFLNSIGQTKAGVKNFIDLLGQGQSQLGNEAASSPLKISPADDKEKFKNLLITWYVPSLNEFGDEIKPFLKDKSPKIKAAAESLLDSIDQTKAGAEKFIDLLDSSAARLASETKDVLQGARLASNAGPLSFDYSHGVALRRVQDAMSNFQSIERLVKDLDVADLQLAARNASEKSRGTVEKLKAMNPSNASERLSGIRTALDEVMTASFKITAKNAQSKFKNAVTQLNQNAQAALIDAKAALDRIASAARLARGSAIDELITNYKSDPARYAGDLQEAIEFLRTNIDILQARLAGNTLKSADRKTLAERLGGYRENLVRLANQTNLSAVGLPNNGARLATVEDVASAVNKELRNGASTDPEAYDETLEITVTQRLDLPWRFVGRFSHLIRYETNAEWTELAPADRSRLLDDILARTGMGAWKGADAFKNERLNGARLAVEEPIKPGETRELALDGVWQLRMEGASVILEIVEGWPLAQVTYGGAADQPASFTIPQNPASDDQKLLLSRVGSQPDHAQNLVIYLNSGYVSSRQALISVSREKRAFIVENKGRNPIGPVRYQESPPQSPVDPEKAFADLNQEAAARQIPLSEIQFALEDRIERLSSDFSTKQARLIPTARAEEVITRMLRKSVTDRTVLEALVEKLRHPVRNEELERSAVTRVVGLLQYEEDLAKLEDPKRPENEVRALTLAELQLRQNQLESLNAKLLAFESTADALRRVSTLLERVRQERAVHELTEFTPEQTRYIKALGQYCLDKNAASAIGALELTSKAAVTPRQARAFLSEKAAQIEPSDEWKELLDKAAHKRQLRSAGESAPIVRVGALDPKSPAAQQLKTLASHLEKGDMVLTIKSYTRRTLLEIQNGVAQAAVSRIGASLRADSFPLNAYYNHLDQYRLIGARLAAPEESGQSYVYKANGQNELAQRLISLRGKRVRILFNAVDDKPSRQPLEGVLNAAAYSAEGEVIAGPADIHLYKSRLLEVLPERTLFKPAGETPSTGARLAADHDLTSGITDAINAVMKRQDDGHINELGRVKEAEVTNSLVDNPSAASTHHTYAQHYDLVLPHIVAAEGAHGWTHNLGKKNAFAKEASDAAATFWIRTVYKMLAWLSGVIVIGEGERDYDLAGEENRGMLYIGEKVGGVLNQKPNAPAETDIAQDVLEVTNGVPLESFLGSGSVAVYAPRGTLAPGPDIYMNKWIVGAEAKAADINVEHSADENLKNISTALGRPIDRLHGAILLRPAHIRLITEMMNAGLNIDNNADLLDLRKALKNLDSVRGSGEKDKIEFEKRELKKVYDRLSAKAKVTGMLKIGNLILLADGDLMPTFALALPKDHPNHIDFLTGRGGAPEGVLAAAATKAIGGKMSGTLVSYEMLKESAMDADLRLDGKKFTKTELDRLRKDFGIVPQAEAAPGQRTLEQIYSADDLIKTDDFVFVFTAVKDHPLIPGLKAPALDPAKGTYRTTTLWAAPGDVKIVDVVQDTELSRLRRDIHNIHIRQAEESGRGERENLLHELSQKFYQRGKAYLAFQDYDRAIAAFHSAKEQLKALELFHDQEDVQHADAAILHTYAVRALQRGIGPYGKELTDPVETALSLFEESLAKNVEVTDRGLRTREIYLEVAEFLGDHYRAQAEKTTDPDEELALINRAKGFYQKVLNKEPSRRAVVNKIRDMDHLAGARLAGNDILTAIASGNVDAAIENLTRYRREFNETELSYFANWIKNRYQGPIRLVGKIGGSTIAVEAANEHGLLGFRVVVPTNQPGDTEQAVTDRVAAAIRKVAEFYGPADRVEGVFLTAPGFFNPDGTLSAPESNIPGWNRAGFSVEKAIQKSLNTDLQRRPSLGEIPVTVVHDGTGGALGELSRFGTLADGSENDFLFIIAGTGIGTRRMVNGQPYLDSDPPQVSYLINEMPHTLLFNGDAQHPDFYNVGLRTKGLPPEPKFLDEAKTIRNPKYKDDLEDRTSGPAIEAYARAEIARLKNLPANPEHDDAIALTSLETSKDFMKALGVAANQGNALAKRIIRERAYELGIGLAALLVEYKNHFGVELPKKIIIGSGVAQIGTLFLDAVQAGLHDRLNREGRGFETFDVNHVILSAVNDDTARELLGGLPTTETMKAYSEKLKAAARLAHERTFEKLMGWYQAIGQSLEGQNQLLRLRPSNGSSTRMALLGRDQILPHYRGLNHMYRNNDFTVNQVKIIATNLAQDTAEYERALDHGTRSYQAGLDHLTALGSVLAEAPIDVTGLSEKLKSFLPANPKGDSLFVEAVGRVRSVSPGTPLFLTMPQIGAIVDYLRGKIKESQDYRPLANELNGLKVDKTAFQNLNGAGARMALVLYRKPHETIIVGSDIRIELVRINPPSYKHRPSVTILVRKGRTRPYYLNLTSGQTVLPKSLNKDVQIGLVRITNLGEAELYFKTMDRSIPIDRTEVRESKDKEKRDKSAAAATLAAAAGPSALSERERFLTALEQLLDDRSGNGRPAEGARLSTVVFSRGIGEQIVVGPNIMLEVMDIDYEKVKLSVWDTRKPSVKREVVLNGNNKEKDIVNSATVRVTVGLAEASRNKARLYFIAPQNVEIDRLEIRQRKNRQRASLKKLAGLNASHAEGARLAEAQTSTFNPPLKIVSQTENKRQLIQVYTTGTSQLIAKAYFDKPLADQIAAELLAKTLDSQLPGLIKKNMSLRIAVQSIIENDAWMREPAESESAVLDFEYEDYFNGTLKISKNGSPILIKVKQTVKPSNEASSAVISLSQGESVKTITVSSLGSDHAKEVAFKTARALQGQFNKTHQPMNVDQMIKVLESVHLDEVGARLSDAELAQADQIGARLAAADGKSLAGKIVPFLLKTTLVLLNYLSMPSAQAADFQVGVTPSLNDVRFVSLQSYKADLAAARRDLRQEPAAPVSIIGRSERPVDAEAADQTKLAMRHLEKGEGVVLNVVAGDLHIDQAALREMVREAIPFLRSRNVFARFGKVEGGKFVLDEAYADLNENAPEGIKLQSYIGSEKSLSGLTVPAGSGVELVEEEPGRIVPFVDMAARTANIARSGDVSDIKQNISYLADRFAVESADPSDLKYLHAVPGDFNAHKDEILPKLRPFRILTLKFNFDQIISYAKAVRSLLAAA